MIESMLSRYNMAILAALLATPMAMAQATGKAPSAASGAGAGRPPGYSTTITGSIHDFDYFMDSGWMTRQHKLKVRGVGSKDWQDFIGTLCATPYLGGMATVDEIYFPERREAGLTLRTYDSSRKQWSIYWVSSTTGKLGEPPMVGGFHGGKLGEFYAADHDAKGRPIKVRFLWKILDHDHARWEQAFSYDDRSWETNWTADFTRADRDKVCKDGLPRRSEAPAKTVVPAKR
jgi:hypothetical protein